MSIPCVTISTRIPLTTAGTLLQFFLLRGYMPKTRSELLETSLKELTELLIENNLVKRMEEEESLDLYISTFREQNTDTLRQALREINLNSLKEEANEVDDAMYMQALNAEKKIESEPQI